MKLRRTRMVGDVSMDVIYRGMSLERLDKLCALESEAWIAAQAQFPDTEDWEFGKFKRIHDAEFRRLADRAATKAAWHRNRKVSK